MQAMHRVSWLGWILSVKRTEGRVMDVWEVVHAGRK